jgi:hypothetical protein
MNPPSSVLLRSNNEWLEMFKEAVHMAEPLYSSAQRRPPFLTEISVHESKLRAMVERYISILAHRVQHNLWLKAGIEKPLHEIYAHLSPLIWENVNDNEDQKGGPRNPRSQVGSLISAISGGDADSVCKVSNPEDTYMSSVTGKVSSSDTEFDSRWTVKSKL